MGTHNRYNLKLRRRREGKTNYKRRLALLKSREPRLVVRKTNQHTIVQIVEYDPNGDLVRVTASTAQLEKLGWKGSTSNIPAAYLAGFVAGTKAKKLKIKSAVVDLGMQVAFPGGRLFAAVQGAVDAGLDIPFGEESAPAEDRVSGAHIDEKASAVFEQVKKKAGDL